MDKPEPAKKPAKPRAPRKPKAKPEPVSSATTYETDHTAPGSVDDGCPTISNRVDGPVSPAKPTIGLGWFAGSLDHMTKEEHLGKLRKAAGQDVSPIVSNVKQDDQHHPKATTSPNQDGNTPPTSQTPTSTSQDGEKNVGNDRSLVSSAVASGADPVESIPRARLPGEKRHAYWERMRKAARLAGLPRGQGPGSAYVWATEQAELEFPYVSPSAEPNANPSSHLEPESIVPNVGTMDESTAISQEKPAVPVQEPDQGVVGLGNFPTDWPKLPANAQLQAEIAWVTANRLLVRSGNGVDLSKAMSPPPSYSALSWLETSILFPSKFADISVKATADQDDEKEFIRREKMAVEEIRSILAEMLEAKTG